MQIGIIGAGAIGTTLARKLAAAGHTIKLAGSKGADAVRAKAEAVGAEPVSARNAANGVDAIILSVPFPAASDVADALSEVPADVVVIDTSNYYPFRDGQIAEVDAGRPESVWVSEQLGRPVIKVFNAVLAHTLSERGAPEGTPGRLAIPVAGDDVDGKRVAGVLVNDTGFDYFDAGSLSESWRQQPGTPAYCTELTLDELASALAAGDKSRAAQNRDKTMESLWGSGGTPTHDEMVMANRAVTA